MFGMFKVQDKKKDDAKLLEVINILFPPLGLNEHVGDDGKATKYHIDYSVDSNLEAALMDLQEGHNDETTRRTINKVLDRLSNVRRLLEAYAEFDPEATYIVVSNDSSPDDDEIIPADDI